MIFNSKKTVFKWGKINQKKKLDMCRITQSWIIARCSEQSGELADSCFRDLHSKGLRLSG